MGVCVRVCSGSSSSSTSSTISSCNSSHHGNVCMKEGLLSYCVLRWCSQYGIELVIQKVMGLSPGRSGNNLTSVTKQHNLVPVQGMVKPCSWEGNCQSGIALAIHHRLQGLIHLQAHAYTPRGECRHEHVPHGTHFTLPFVIYCTS